MYNKEQLIEAVASIGVSRNDTLLVHSSMKSIGIVEGGAETVLDALIEYMKPGLLLFPAHTWALMDEQKHPVFYPLTDPTCVGLLPNMFLKRPGVLRSLHPTHSIAAIGLDAAQFIAGEETCSTPCPRKGCYGKLYDRKAKILFLGCSLKSNTFMHGVEEWNNIPHRFTKLPAKYKIAVNNGQIIDRPVYKHESPVGDISVHYSKMEAPFLREGCAVKGKIGDAISILCDAVGMADFTSDLLKKNHDLFLDDAPIV